LSGNKILLIGKIPPPTGGVTVHFERLIYHLKPKVKYAIYDLNKLDYINFLFILRQYAISHLHTSNVYLRLVFSLYGKIIRTKTIITYHGDVGRFNKIKNMIDCLSIRFSDVPIVINKQSYKKALVYNSNTLLLSAFLKPIDNKPIDLILLKKVEQLQLKGKVYLTNAFNLSFDKNGKEIYGISSLLKMFSTLDSHQLIIVDPSGNYKKFINENAPELENAAFWVTEIINFHELLRISNGFIRNTTTDGDSLSIWESLSLGKKTFATSIINRPNGVILYKNVEELKIKLLDKNIKSRYQYQYRNTINHLLNCYNKLEN